MQFSEVMQSMRQEPGPSEVWKATVPEEWTQGRSVFGGLQAALAVRAMRALVPAELPLRTLQVTFVAPVAPGQVCTRAKVLRRGKSAIQVEARLGEGAETQCLVSAVFGASRPSAVVVRPKQPPVESKKPIPFQFVPGVTPNFTQYLPMTWLVGTPPYTGSPLTRAVIEVDVRDPGPMSEAHLLAIADAPPPLALSMLKQAANGSSMTWTMEFLTGDLRDLPLQRWRLDIDLIAARDGYTSQSVMVWSPGGEAVAISRQSMVVFG